MLKLCMVLLIAVSALTEAKPGAVAYTGLPVAAPLAYQGPGFVTATSSQYFARNYNGIAAAPLVAAAPYVASAPYVAAAPFGASAAYVF